MAEGIINEAAIIDLDAEVTYNMMAAVMKR